MSLNLTKFCQHCQKAGHTDDECWSARVVRTPWPFGQKSEAPPMTENDVRRIVREELAKATKEQP